MRIKTVSVKIFSLQNLLSAVVRKDVKGYPDVPDGKCIKLRRSAQGHDHLGRQSNFEEHEKEVLKRKLPISLFSIGYHDG